MEDGALTTTRIRKLACLETRFWEGSRTSPFTHWRASPRHFDKRLQARGGVALATITFGAKSAEQMIAGKKTVTFRRWPKARVKAGEVYDATRMGYPPQKFARIRVTLLRRIKLKEIDDKLAKKDGASSSTEAKAYWSKQGFRADDELWLVEFELVRQ